MLKHAYLDGDMIVAVVMGDLTADATIPEQLAALPIERLRFDGSAIVDGAAYHTFYIDSDGNKHIEPAPGRQELTCEWDDLITNDAGTWRKQTASENVAPLIKAECSRRILVEADHVAQLNMAAAAGGGVFDQEAMSAFQDGLAWIASMRAKCAELIDNADETYEMDSHWPQIPAVAKALAEDY